MTDVASDVAPAGVKLRWAWVLLAALLGYQLTRSPTSDDGMRNLFEQAVYLLPFVLSVGFGALAAVRSPAGDDRRFWTLLTATNVFILVLEVAYIIGTRQGQQGTMVTGAPSFLLAAVPAVLFAYLLASLSRATAGSHAGTLEYVATGLISALLIFLVTYGLLVEPLLASRGVTDHLVQAQTAFRTTIGLTVLIGTFLNVGALKATAWRRWEMLTVGGIAVYALGLCLEPALIVSEFGAPSYVEQIAEALWMTGQFLVFMGAVVYLAEGVRGVPVRRHLPVSLLARGWSAIVFDTVVLVSTMTALATSFVADGAFERGMYLASSVVLACLFLCRLVFGAIASGRLLSSSVIDQPTGLYSAQHFAETLESEIDIAVRTGEPLSIALLDLDDLELMDTVEGFGSSEKVIMTAAAAIRSRAGGQVYSARLGWDLFGFVLPETAPADALRRMERVRAAILAATGVTASAGIATFPTDTIDRAELTRLAEGALYHAKEHGKNRTVVYDPAVVRQLSAEERITALERQSQLGAVRALAASVDNRDRGTKHHSQHVAELAVSVGRVLRLDEADLHELDLAALVHDVGYIAVPDRILRKPNALLSAEQAHVRAHPLLAERIAESAGLTVALPWIRGHHERWDGAGYPDGLAGEDIPLPARVLAVCDAFDAMTHERPFRRAMTKQAALQEIDHNMGKQFDPRAAEALIRIVSAAEEPAPVRLVPQEERSA